MGNDSFAWLPHLGKYLSLEYNNIEHLSSQLFLWAFPAWDTLNWDVLTRQSISLTSFPKIDDFSFQWLKCLSTLNMEDNNFPGIKRNTFTGLVRLKILNLSNSFSSLRTLTNETFLSLASSPLLLLNLTKNKISKFRVVLFLVSTWGPDSAQWNWAEPQAKKRGLDNIVVTYLSYNKYLELTTNSFTSVPSLQRLMLLKGGPGEMDSSLHLFTLFRTWSFWI